MKKCIIIAACFIAAGLAGCSKAPQQPIEHATSSDSGHRVYQVRGIVRGSLGNDGLISIEHEDIPGLMPSMTMPFEVKDRSEGARLKPGDGIGFHLIAADNKWWIEQVTKIDPASVHLPKADAMPGSGLDVERLKEGDAMPPFKLTDQAGRELGRDSFAGKTVVLTFFFTRCPMPNFCPLMSQHFEVLQRSIEADPTLRGRVQLISISFDPEHDTPQMLAQYGSAFSKNLDSWRFASGSTGEIGKLTGEFSVYVNNEGGTISHTLCTAMISPEGTVKKVWRGNGWETDEVMNALRNTTAAR